MPTFIPGTSLTPEEAGLIHSDVTRRIETHGNYKTVVDNYTENQSWWCKTKEVLKNSITLATTVGCLFLNSAYNEGDSFEQYMRLYTSCPASFKSFPIWTLYQSAQETEIEFVKECKTPNTEEVLTGYFLATLGATSRANQERYNNLLSATNSEISVKKLELQVQNRERDSGGDYALLFEWKDDNGEMRICPVVFQAKRVARIEADISQENTKTGKQFDVLSKLKCNSAYIFYNCDTNGVTERPRLPVIKKVKDIKINNGYYKTSTVEDVVSFSTFILEMMSGGSFRHLKSRRDALNAIMLGVDELELSNIITFSVDASAISEYQSEYQRYLSLLNSHENHDGGDFSP